MPVTGQMFLFLPHLKWVTIPLGYLTNAASLKGRLQTGHRLEKEIHRDNRIEGNFYEHITPWPMY